MSQLTLKKQALIYDLSIGICLYMLFKSAKIFSNQTPMANEVSTIQTKARQNCRERDHSERAHLPGVDAYCSGSDGLWGGIAPSLFDPSPDTPDRSKLEIRFTLAWLAY